jgi:hypothetical protein
VAQAQRPDIEATSRDVDALVLLSEVPNYDFAKKPLDEPFSDEELAELSFQGFRDRVIRQSRQKEPDGARFHNRLRPRHSQGAHDVLRQPPAGRRSNGGMVYGAVLRRVRPGSVSYAGRL